MSKNYSERDIVLIAVCLSIYLTSLLAANTLGIKLMPFLFGTHLSVSIFFFPFVFIGTDVIGEVFGKKIAKGFVVAGIVSTALFILYTFLSNIFSWSEAAFWVKDGYGQVFDLSLRMAIASLVAFAVGEYQDFFIFWKVTDKLGKKLFWLRSLCSNIWSQFLDTGLFMIIAFAGVYPPHQILLMSIPWWIYKVCMGFVYTPLSYGMINILKYYRKDDSQSI
ncbi:queuosine precursor transporter [Candidatus Nomurabacteria bacterium]|nr:queuosine precursor transporter [Candidatus Nomurabacteria bacterium]